MPNYVEPFFGSGAVMLARPTPPGTETVCDADGFLANFWRAVQSEPDRVAELMDWPVNEVDLEARHKYLCLMPDKTEFLQRMRDDPDFYDVKRAAWWCWGLCAWIGSGWCEGEWHGPESVSNRGSGINIRDPEHGGKRPELGPGRGVHRQVPHLRDGGQGVHRPSICDFTAYMRALQTRFRRVRVTCGDWSRICGPTPTYLYGLCGVFLDPPYSAEAERYSGIYREDSLTVAHDVRAWCLANGNNRKMRIVLCGYAGEGHEVLEEHGWGVHIWKAAGGRGTKNGNYLNNLKERIWYSPYCLVRQPTLF